MTEEDTRGRIKEGRRLLQRLMTMREAGAEADELTAEIADDANGVELLSALVHATFIIEHLVATILPVPSMREQYLQGLFARMESM